MLAIANLAFRGAMESELALVDLSLVEIWLVVMMMGVQSSMAALGSVDDACLVEDS